MNSKMTNLKIQKDNGEIEEFNKEDMTDQQRSLFDDILSLQSRCIELLLGIFILLLLF